MRVVMVIQGFHPRIGGAERQLLAVAPRLRARGVDVHVVTRRYPGMSTYAVVHGVPVHRVALSGPKPLRSATFTMGAIAELLRLRPDVIHAHEVLSPATVAAIAGAVRSTPVIAKVLISGELGYLRRERPLGRQRWHLLRRRVATFVAISADIDAELARAGVPAERRRCIPNGVDTDRFRPPEVTRRRDARAALQLRNGPAMAFVGRLEPQKNLLELVDVWNHLRGSYRDAVLLVAGDGSQAAELRARAGAGVRFLGPVEDVTEVLAAVDGFVLPSWREGLSNALLEAMASGLPVVASDVGGATDVVQPGRSGLLVSPGDPAGLTAALTSLFDDPAQRARLGAGARDIIEQRYSLDGCVEDLHDLYQELV